MQSAFSCFSKLSSIRPEGIQKYDCLCNEFSKDLYKNKYTKMNCWRNVALADKFDMSPEDAEKKVKDIRLFFSAITWKPVDR